MPSILRLPCVVSNGIGNRATGDRSNRATATGPPGAGLRDRTPTTPNAVRRAFAAGTRLRRARTSGGLPGSVVNARSSRPRPAGERRQPLLSQGGAPCGARRGMPNPAGLRGIGPRGDVRSPGDGFGNSRWWNPGERRGRGGARLTRRVREEYRVYFDRNATMSGAKRATRFSRDGSPAERPKRNDERRESDAVNSRWWNPRERRGRGGARLIRRARGNTWCISTETPTSGRSDAFQPGWIAGRTPRGFRHRLFGRDGSPAERRVGFTTGCLGGMDRRPNAARVSPPAGRPARDGSEFPDSDISGFPHPPAGRDGGAPDSAGAWRTSGRARSPAVVHTPIRQVSKSGFGNQVSEIRGQRTSQRTSRRTSQRTLRPGRETGCR